ncbi:MAG TPA: tRNA (adenosine(37)-N6)-dimethylallyltransferase MiaA [Pyrinomonadaceae bacterium]|nr:tRNA (adenosine(37)-N6)-dimethylallyltransferase MiaA [Pyrinomonadaceae bacterium]
MTETSQTIIREEGGQDVRAPSIIAIVGPTASGKSALGIEVALRAGGEIINCDSVQVYQQIEIATAKVPFEERRGVAHHLIDFVSPIVTFTAADWARAALQTIDEIESRGHVAVLVGGTGFYLRALRRPFFPSPATDEDLRQRLTRIREHNGPERLHRILQKFDPDEAGTLNARDWPRVQRAIEFYLQTGEKISSQRPLRPSPPDVANRLRIFALNPPRAELYERINQRTDEHFGNGLVDEVRGLLDKGVPGNTSALGAHGYRRVVEYLKGERTLEGAIEQTKLDVRHYAKRQMTWFRREAGVEWIEGFGNDPQVQERVLALLY